MKKLLVLFALIFTVSAASAQKNGYIYSKKVFDVIPQYDSAVKEVEAFAKQNRETIDKKLEEVAFLYEQYRQNVGQMSSSRAQQYQQLIIAREKEANDLEKAVFGQEGTLEKKQKELMAPVEKQVLDAVTAIAAERGYDMVFDLSLVKVTIYQSPAHDLTQAVIERLGY